jgi:predicted nuclease with TOPRIM domain
MIAPQDHLLCVTRFPFILSLTVRQRTPHRGASSTREQELERELLTINAKYTASQTHIQTLAGRLKSFEPLINARSKLQEKLASQAAEIESMQTRLSESESRIALLENR